MIPGLLQGWEVRELLVGIHAGLLLNTVQGYSFLAAAEADRSMATVANGASALVRARMSPCGP
jgi:hypothetical protein